MNLLKAVWSVFVVKPADLPGEVAFPKPPTKLPYRRYSLKRINIKARSIERIGKRLLPLPLLAYLASIRLTVKFISILENNNLRVSWGSPRNLFKQVITSIRGCSTIP